ncbi:serine/threonine protein kinase [Arthrobacter sp. zg-Y40]|uniref:serine/threonine-protein kinase n=1 Tax=Arthrobacter sp. zg-Y40 TaxID=2886939 RepID=UPI001D145B34|nr:serine/threonine-protein kinase [Arthrobacter sp. zg-Y40]MCC3280362.1 serine/threonine protein kinase [Arthrobacter sp. zg-Y40]
MARSAPGHLSQAPSLPRTDSSGFSPHILIEGRFCLDEPIGRGTAAYVWRATDLATLDKVAVKIFSAPLGHSPSGREAAREAEALTAVRSPRVVQVIATGTVGHPVTGVQTPFLVLELVPGPNLRQHLAGSGALPPAAAAQLGADLTEGLAAIHAADYLHRDIKPSNILLAPGTGAKVADLGTAVSTLLPARSASSYGSLPYMSPEQVTGSRLTPATDIYSLGLVLLEALAGRRAFDLPQVESMVARTVRAPEIPSTLPAGWRSLLTAMTALSPQERPTAEQCRRALSALFEDAPAGFRDMDLNAA